MPRFRACQLTWSSQKRLHSLGSPDRQPQNAKHERSNAEDDRSDVRQPHNRHSLTESSRSRWIEVPRHYQVCPHPYRKPADGRANRAGGEGNQRSSDPFHTAIGSRSSIGFSTSGRAFRRGRAGLLANLRGRRARSRKLSLNCERRRAAASRGCRESLSSPS